MVTTAVRSPGGSRYCPVSASVVYFTATDIPTRFNALFRQCAGVSLLRLRIAGHKGQRNLYRLSIGGASRLALRSRLTLIRLALIRNPWSSGGRVSRPPCRYLFLHLLFRFLQHGSRHTFHGRRNAPLPTQDQPGSHGFGSGLMPGYYPCGITRLVSCYALFK